MQDDKTGAAGDEQDGPEIPPDEDLVRRVDRAMAPYREGLTEEEWHLYRHFLLFLAETHPRFSTWIEDVRPRDVPDRSGIAAKKDITSLEAAARSEQAKAGGGRSP